MTDSGTPVQFGETPEQAILRDTVHQLAARYGYSYFIAKAHANERADELWGELGSAGFLGVAIPQAFGGGGLGIAEMGIIAEELAATGCPNLLLAVLAVCGPVIDRFGTDEQKMRWLPALANGTVKMAIGITEPDAGTNSNRIATKAVRSGSEFRINGAKTYISGIDEADDLLVIARTAPRSSTEDGLSLIVVERKSPGLTIAPIRLGITSTERQFSVHFDNVAAPGANLIGAEGQGLRQLFYGLNAERIVSAAVATGLATYAINKAAKYAVERQVWGVPIGQHQGVAHPLAEAYIQTQLARLMNQKAAWLFDQGLNAAEASNMAKHAAARAALASLEQAVQVHGGNGLAAEYGLADLWGIVRLYGIAPVSAEMVLNHIARHSLGLPRSY